MTATEFWTFSVRVYEQHKETFLALQDEGGANVNLLLLALWLTEHDRQLSASAWQQLKHAVAGEIEDTEACRAKRRRLDKIRQSDAYHIALAEELESERRQQQSMIAWLTQSDALQRTETADPMQNIQHLISAYPQKLRAQVKTLLSVDKY